MSEPPKNGRPNIFGHATKELSQDAMICWLIDWACQPKATTEEEEELRRCGLRFVTGIALGPVGNCGTPEAFQAAVGKQRDAPRFSRTAAASTGQKARVK